MPTPGAVPASLGRRLLAFVIDQVAALLLGGAFVVAGLLPALRGVPDVAGPPPLVVVGSVLLLALLVFQWWYQGSRGFTIGKRLVGVRTLSATTGHPIGLGRAFVRAVVPLAGVLVLGVGQLVVLVSPLFDRSGRRQGWHDKAAGAMVFDVVVGRDPSVAQPVSASAAAQRLDVLLASRGRADQPAPDDTPAPDDVPATPVQGRPTGLANPEPVPVVAAQPVPQPVLVAEPEPLAPDVEATRLRPARAKVPQLPSGHAAPVVRLSDGQQIHLTGTVLVGRSPAARPDDGAVQLVTVADPGRSVSKTHLAIGVDPAGVWLRDRASTNGTVVTLADGQQILCAAEQRVRLPAGASVAFGDYGLSVAEEASVES